MALKQRRSEQKFDAHLAWLESNCACYIGSSAPAPDYTPMATASKESAQLGKELGEAQLAESKRQYDKNMAVAEPVVAAQLGLMKQTEAQGTDYYDYMKQYSRPLEQNIYAEATDPAAAGADAAERAKIADLNQELVNRAGESNTQVYNRNKDQIESDASRAVADARTGYTNALNVAARQGLRYGFNPNSLAGVASTMSGQQAAQQAAAANATREASIGTMYGRGVTAAQQGLAGGEAQRSMGQQDKSIALAKKLDLSGLYRDLAGASQGAYQLALGAGSNAVGTQMAPGNAYQQGIAQSNATQQTGKGQQINGLGNILQTQASVYNNSQGGGDAMMGALGTIAGAGIGAGIGAW